MTPSRHSHRAWRHKHPGTEGALRQAVARWRDFDHCRGHADYEAAAQAARDAMAFEDKAGFVLRPLIRLALRGVR